MSPGTSAGSPGQRSHSAPTNILPSGHPWQGAEPREREGRAGHQRPPLCAWPSCGLHQSSQGGRKPSFREGWEHLTLSSRQRGGHDPSQPFSPQPEHSPVSLGHLESWQPERPHVEPTDWGKYGPSGPWVGSLLAEDKGPMPAPPAAWRAGGKTTGHSCQHDAHQPSHRGRQQSLLVLFCRFKILCWTCGKRRPQGTAGAFFEWLGTPRPQKLTLCPPWAQTLTAREAHPQAPHLYSFYASPRDQPQCALDPVQSASTTGINWMNIRQRGTRTSQCYSRTQKWNVRKSWPAAISSGSHDLVEMADSNPCAGCMSQGRSKGSGQCSSRQPRGPCCPHIPLVPPGSSFPYMCTLAGRGHALGPATRGRDLACRDGAGTCVGNSQGTPGPHKPLPGLARAQTIHS